MSSLVRLPTETDISKLTVEDDVKLLSSLIASTAAHIECMARVWVHLQSLGVDLSRFRVAISEYFPAIAGGRATAEAVHKFAERPQLLKQILTLPIVEQRKVAADDTVTVVVKKGNRLCPETKHLMALSMAEAQVAIGDGRLRAPAEQKEWLRHNTPTPRGRPLGRKTGINVVVDDVDLDALPDDLLEQLAELADKVGGPKRLAQLAAKFASVVKEDESE